ncbi:MAG: hypothetical protein OXG64_06425 [Chloroflexi bacterium]|nr:hypothetical protein [Chloroflexota bacterium]
MNDLWLQGPNAVAGTHESVEQRAAWLFMNGKDEYQVYEGLRQLPDIDAVLQRLNPVDRQAAERELHTCVSKVGTLVGIWSTFREIETITRVCTHARQRPFTVRASVLQPLEPYARKRPMVVPAMQDTPVAALSTGELDGIVAFAALRWYVVQVRHLLGGIVPKSKSEIDWFWTTFGEHHLLDVIDFRNQLAHFDDDLDTAALHEKIDWFVGWLGSLTEKIQRTSFSVVDSARRD